MGVYYLFIVSANDVHSLGDFTKELFLFANKFEWRFFGVYFFNGDRVFRIGVELRENMSTHKVRHELVRNISQKYRIRQVIKQKSKYEVMASLVNVSSKQLLELGEMFPKIEFTTIQSLVTQAMDIVNQ